MSDPSLTFREAARTDVAAILAHLRQDALWSERETGEIAQYEVAFDALAGSPTQIFVGELAGEIVATYQLTLIRELSIRAALRAQLEGVRVAAHLRGQGLGARLVECAEARARAAGATLMQLTSDGRRTDAHRFYVRLGYAQSHAGFKKPL